ncbi:permease [Paraclostridium bifermentans]|uniref:permease n=2 Tax=Paraclostridium bifermentans TaxID=1490 RepID=UPI00359C9BD1
MNIALILKKYKYVLVSIFIFLVIYLINKPLGINIFNNIKLNIFQMLSILPPIMIILSLLDTWISREYFIKHMGPNSGFKGVIIAFLIAFFSAGPMYAAFPFASVLVKKGVKLSNILIFLNAWCVTKLSTLIFEFTSLGFKFTLIRLLVNIPGIIIMGYMIEYVINTKRAID